MIRRPETCHAVMGTSIMKPNTRTTLKEGASRLVEIHRTRRRRGGSSTDGGRGGLDGQRRPSRARSQPAPWPLGARPASADPRHRYYWEERARSATLTTRGGRGRRIPPDYARGYERPYVFYGLNDAFCRGGYRETLEPGLASSAPQKKKPKKKEKKKRKTKKKKKKEKKKKKKKKKNITKKKEEEKKKKKKTFPPSLYRSRPLPRLRLLRRVARPPSVLVS